MGYNVVVSGNKLLLVKPDLSEIELSSWNNKTNEVFTSESRKRTRNNYENDKIYVLVEDSKVTVDDVWEDCQKYGCNYKSKEEIGYYIGYKYVYNIKNNELLKIRADILD